MKNKVKVALGLSGGVDSAVSAYLLQKQGFDVNCVYLNCYDPPAGGPGCRGDNDRKDALAVAMHLGLPFRVLDFRKAYQTAVIDYFKKEYLAGRTPNPDVVCNRDIKFGLFLDWAIKHHYEYIATGHYADGRHPERPKGVEGSSVSDKNILIASPRLDGTSLGLSTEFIPPKAGLETTEATGIFLSQPKDLHKDQTYFLWAVSGEKFKKVLFPLGDLLKTEVREIALKIGLPVAKKKDSTGICFVGEVRVEDFLKKLGVREKEGEVVDSSYQVIGSHRGVWFYTIGQRHGFGITNWPPCHPERSEAESRDLAAGDKNIVSLDSSTSSLRSVARNDGVTDRPPLYVIEKDIKKNRLVVGFGADCYRDSFEVSECNWLIGGIREIGDIGEVRVRIRHGGELIECSLTATRNWQPATGNPQQVQRDLRVTDNELRITVSLRSAQRGISPGQSAVFYSKDGAVLGGGIIQ